MLLRTGTVRGPAVAVSGCARRVALMVLSLAKTCLEINLHPVPKAQTYGTCRFPSIVYW